MNPKVLYLLLGGIISETWGYCPNKCKLENEGCPVKYMQFFDDSRIYIKY